MFNLRPTPLRRSIRLDVMPPPTLRDKKIEAIGNADSLNDCVQLFYLIPNFDFKALGIEFL